MIMMHNIKKYAVIALAGMVLLPCAYAQKNVYDVNSSDLPDRFEKLLKLEPKKWNFNFSKYGDEAAVLVTDPILQRTVQEGEDAGEKRVTGIYVSSNSEGLNLLVFCSEGGLKDALEKGKAFPYNSLEIYFAPGDSDNSKIEHYYQFIVDLNTNEFNDYPWLTETRSFRSIKNHIRYETRKVSNGYVTKICILWDGLFDKLPFSDKADNFWRLSVIRWCASGGQTWGGVVHAATSAGYIRLPKYSDAQKGEIYQYVLNRAWERYRQLLAVYGPALVPDMKEPYRDQLQKTTRTFMNIQDDRVFVNEILVPMVAERDALGAKIAVFEKMSLLEQKAFYEQNIGKLMNFDYDVQEAYGKYIKNKLFKN